VEIRAGRVSEFGNLPEIQRTRYLRFTLYLQRGVRKVSLPMGARLAFVGNNARRPPHASGH
jgi:hypothetical protein